ncbi:MAG: hypothetical protein ACRD2U_12210 [Terriglobales bacterium]
MTVRRVMHALLGALLFSLFAVGQTLTGNVKNATTGKPAAGDEVILLKLGQGMEEAGHTKADSKGNFSFTLDDTQSPHLVRAIHQDVTYHKMAPPGTTSVDVDVYDVGKKIDGIEVVADIMRIQAEQGQLDVTREFAVQNSSKPPLTQMNERNLEFYLPEGAQIGESSAMTGHGNPLKTAPTQEAERNRYSFNFPLRPGITQFQLTYQLPYTGSANLDPRSLYPLQHFVAIVPKSMEFAAAQGANFKPMNDPNQPDANVQLASAPEEGQSLAFKISGEGTLQARVEAGGTQGGGAPSQNDNRPGGGLGPPSDAPDPLQQYRWYILAGFTIALVVGAIFVASRRRAVRSAAPAKDRVPAFEDEYEEPKITDASVERTSTTRVVVTEPSPSRSALLEELKEELFRLEVEHKQGEISQQEYDKTKSALDQMLQRALKRAAANHG